HRRPWSERISRRRARPVRVRVVRPRRVARSRARGRDARAGGGSSARVHVEHRGGASASSLRRRAGARARAVQLGPETAELEEQVARAHDLLARHLEGPVAAEPWVQHVEYDPEIPRWYVRFGCDGRDATTIYFDLHQRTLRYEVYFLPDPQAN